MTGVVRTTGVVTRGTATRADAHSVRNGQSGTGLVTGVGRAGRRTRIVMTDDPVAVSAMRLIGLVMRRAGRSPGAAQAASNAEAVTRIGVHAGMTAVRAGVHRLVDRVTVGPLGETDVANSVLVRMNVTAVSVPVGTEMVNVRSALIPRVVPDRADEPRDQVRVVAVSTVAHRVGSGDGATRIGRIAVGGTRVLLGLTTPGGHSASPGHMGMTAHRVQPGRMGVATVANGPGARATRVSGAGTTAAGRRAGETGQPIRVRSVAVLVGRGTTSHVRLVGPGVMTVTRIGAAVMSGAMGVAAGQIVTMMSGTMVVTGMDQASGMPVVTVGEMIVTEAAEAADRRTSRVTAARTASKVVTTRVAAMTGMAVPGPRIVHRAWCPRGWHHAKTSRRHP